MKLIRRLLARTIAACGLAVLAACATQPGHAPVEDKSSTGTGPAPVVAAGAAVPEPARQPGWENAGKPGYYTVKAGDTLFRISSESGQPVKDIMAWNNLTNPNALEVGRVLRVLPPGQDSVAVARPVGPGGAPAAASGASTPDAAASGAAAVPPAAPADDAGVTWIWPAKGPLLAGFDESKSLKGLDIGGKVGDPVVAAADGRVVYAGSGLRGYGNLIIVKHNNTFLTAYAHNHALLVKENDIVRKGQKIAEMGSTDAAQVQLHFEIRRDGKPVDPARLLPPR